MRHEDETFPERDEHLGRLLAGAAPVRERSDQEWSELADRFVAAGDLALARRRAGGWLAPITARPRALTAAAAAIVLLLAGAVYTTPRPGMAFVQASSELIDLLGEDEVRAYFPGMDDTDRLLEAAFAGP